MRLLAEFIMQGRAQAVAVAMLGGLFPYLSQVSLGLVTLRKGWQEGLLVTFAAAIPAFVGVFRDVNPLIVYAAVSVFVAAFCTAYVLRVFASWQITLLANLAICACFGAMFGFDDIRVKAELSIFLDDLQSQNPEFDSAAVKAELEKLTRLTVVGFLAFSFQMASLPGLFLSRWMQAALYNPGGFRDEFYALRLSKPVAAVCFIAYVIAMRGGEEASWWAMFFSLPLVIAGFGLMHHTFAKMGVGATGIAAFYVAFLIMRPVFTMLVVTLGVLDAFMDYRNKFQFKR